MGELATNDPRLTPCMRFVYLQMAAKWYEAGSVFVAAGRDWLADRSDDRFTVDQCRTALDNLKTLGYITPAKWSRVRKQDPGLFAWMKATRAGKQGVWPAVYLMRQDLPEPDRIPEADNPLLAMAAAV